MKTCQYFIENYRQIFSNLETLEKVLGFDLFMGLIANVDFDRLKKTISVIFFFFVFVKVDRKIDYYNVDRNRLFQ